MGTKVLLVLLALSASVAALGTAGCREVLTSAEHVLDPNAEVMLAYDQEAKSLVYHGITAVENGRIDSDTYAGDFTFDYAELTPDYLHTVDPSIVFTMADSLLDAATSPSAAAGSGRVDYWGGESEYAVGCVSESGKSFGMVRLAAGGWAHYIDGQLAEW